MYLMFNGLQIDTSPYEVLATPALATHAASSTIVNIDSMTHTTGESLVFVIESRDQFSNLRTTSLTDVYVVTLTGETSGTVYTAATPVANKNGTYTAKFMFTIAEPYTLQVKLGGVNVKDTPIPHFKVNVGLAQAKYSQLVVSKSPLIAGHNYTFKIQAKDIFSNVAVALTDEPELFDFKLIGISPNNKDQMVIASMQYLFGLYEATFSLPLVGSYSGIIRLV